MITLGIETSCDETALALLETREVQGAYEYRVIGSLIHSQAELHSVYGGVFPTLAKREHGRNLLPLLKKLLTEATPFIGKEKSVLSLEELDKKMVEIKSRFGAKNADLLDSFTDIEFLRSIPNIDRIAVTEGPGLEPALWVGISFAEILGQLWSVNNIAGQSYPERSREISVIPINHMEGHIVGSLLQNDNTQGQWQKLIPCYFPAVALLISGGHTELVKIESVDSVKTFPLKYSIIGQTKDDAVGEAFDKTARLLGLPYPGGPEISKLAELARQKNVISMVRLPRPMIKSNDLDFSFSGLKTAVLYAVRKEEKDKGLLDDNFKMGLAREFEESVNETLVEKLRKAIEFIQSKAIIIGGGVIANITLRNSFAILAEDYRIPLYLPSKHVSGDNALMIALAGSFDQNKTRRKLKADGTKRLNAEARPQ